MKARMIVMVLVLQTAPALADRCEQGLGFAKANDLPRAALYLENCAGADAEKAAAEVATKLRASQLSELNISGDAIELEISAMPGEHLTTPTSIWLKAGTYKLTVGTQTQEVVVPAHARSTVLLEKPRVLQSAPPKNGTVDFGKDEPAEAPVQGPPPKQKFGSILPCKFDGCDTHGGEELVDPLATRAEALRETPPELRIGVRGGIASSERIGASAAITAHWKLLAVRADVSPRERDMERYTDFGFSAGVSHVVWSPSAAWVSLGLALRGDLGTEDHHGLGAAGDVELALRALPVTLGGRYEQGFSGEHAVVVEMGFDWRLFDL